MVLNPSFEIKFKHKHEKDHFETRLEERYHDYKEKLLNQPSILNIEQIREIVLNILKNADIIKKVPESNINRCKLPKYEIKGYSLEISEEVKAYVFQDDDQKIRYLLTVLSTELENLLKN